MPIVCYPLWYQQYWRLVVRPLQVQTTKMNFSEIYFIQNYFT